MSHETPTAAGELRIPAGHPFTKLPAIGFGLAIVGAFALALFGAGDPGRFFAAWLVAFTFFLSIALGCLYFVLIHTAMAGSWGIVVRRIAENAAACPMIADRSTLGLGERAHSEMEKGRDIDSRTENRVTEREVSPDAKANDRSAMAHPP